MVAFTGRASRMTPEGVERAAASVGLAPRLLKTVIQVETGGRGFDRQGRLKMLFEPHIFHRRLKKHRPDLLAAAVAAGLAYEQAGAHPYPADSYPRLQQAVALDEDQALASASWGLPQIMGYNEDLAGYGTPQEMIAVFVDSEDEQVAALARFLQQAGIVAPLLALNFAAVAERYNGHGYRKNSYDTKLQNAYAALPEDVVHDRPDMADDGPSPFAGMSTSPHAPTTDIRDPAPAVQVEPKPASIADPDVKWVQTRLRELLYFETGDVDGKLGDRTKGAILAFRQVNGLPLSAEIDDQLKLALINGKPREIDPARASATAKDIAPVSAIVQQANTQQTAATVGGVAAIGGTGISFFTTQFNAVATALAPVRVALSSVPAWVWGVAALLIAGWLFWQAQKIKDARVAMYQQGKAL